MKPLVFLVCFAAASLQLLHAQLSSRSETISQQYERDRIEGLLVLNQKYITIYQKALDAASKSENFEETNKILERIEALKAENQRLVEKANRSASDNRFTPAGKVITFKSDRDPTKTITVVFKEQGAATFTGINGGPVAFVYKKGKGSNEYLFGRESRKGEGWTLIVNPDGKTGTVKKPNSDFRTAAVIREAK